MPANDFRSTRRAFITATGLMIGFAVTPKAFARAGFQQSMAGGTADLLPMNAFVKIGVDDTVTILSKHLEWGQGVFTALATLVAEEMDADWGQMRAVHSKVDDELYANLGFLELGMRFQGTFGSSSVANSFIQYRQAGAAARTMLVAAAARKWGVPFEAVAVSNGLITHADSGRSSRFGALVQIAARETVPEQPALKNPEAFRYIGKSLPRLDVPDKLTGKAIYTLDIQAEDTLVALVRHPDYFGAKVKSFDDAETRKIQGVVDVRPISAGVAVYAVDTWSAIKGREALRVEWDLSDAETRSSAELEAAYVRQLTEKGANEGAKKGDVDKVFASVKDGFHASRIVYPFLAHAPMETMDAIFTRGKGEIVEIFAGSQIPTFDRDAAANVLGLDPGKIQIQTQLAGGGFGRRGGNGAPFMVEAAEVFQAIGANKPVKFFHTREDDIRIGHYRPMYLHDIRANIGKDGKLIAWDHMVVGQPINPTDGFDFLMAEGIFDLLYTVPNLRVRTHNMKLPVPTMPWRGVAFNHTSFAIETFIDEMLEKVGLDPIEGRIANLADERAKGVLRQVAKMSEWSKSAPAGRQRGVAFVKAYKTYIAQIAEVSRREDGTPQVHRIWCAIDCGLVVNPDQVVAQVEGGISYGLGADLFSEITLGKGGLIQQSNFHDYRVLRISEMPQIEVSIIESKATPTGVGELGGPPAGPAVANAWRRLTGKPIRRLPLVSMASASNVA